MGNFLIHGEKEIQDEKIREKWKAKPKENLKNNEIKFGNGLDIFEWLIKYMKHGLSSRKSCIWSYIDQ